MVVKTKFFGELEISDKDVMVFDEGLPGFQDMHKFTIINDENNTFISYLQSLDSEDVCFIMIPPVFALQDYDINQRQYCKEAED